MAIAMNPYNFVRLDLSRPPQRDGRRIKNEGLNWIFGLWGSIDCRLETLTPLFIGSNITREDKDHKYMDYLLRNGKPFIPGTSLKGAIRSIAEAAANSCLAVATENSRNPANDILSKIPAEFRPCHDRGALCITCRMFGAGRKAMLTGKVSFGDGLPVKVEDGGWVTLPPLMVPKPRHAVWYFPNQQVAGRKFYYHQPGVRLASAEKSPLNKTVHLIGPGSIFEFRVKFWGLDQEELGLLFYALFLEPGLKHKLGMGKPLGLGSVSISPVAAHLCEMHRRYTSWSKGVLTANRLEGEALSEYIAKLTEPWRESQAINLQDVRQILCFDPSRKVSFAYPSREWFRGHGQVSLADLVKQSGLGR